MYLDLMYQNNFMHKTLGNNLDNSHMTYVEFLRLTGTQEELYKPIFSE